MGSWLDAVFGNPLLKALLPIPLVALLAVGAWWLSRGTLRALDEEARLLREADRREGREFDARPAVCLVLVAVVLTLQEYYGGRRFYDELVRPALRSAEAGWARGWFRLDKYDSYFSHLFWVLTRVVGYVLIPLPLWKLLFRKDSLLDMGLRTRGFFRHAWIYVACLVVIVPVVFLVSRQAEFATYYPFYRNSSRSWFDLLIWEAAYFAQFFALELFFRGFMLGALKRTMGSAAIFVMLVPYCMIHYGKPYMEAQGAIIAGLVLGALAMKTRSIYAGFLVHVTVAGLMDGLALASRDGIPAAFWPPG